MDDLIPCRRPRREIDSSPMELTACKVFHARVAKGWEGEVKQPTLAVVCPLEGDASCD